MITRSGHMTITRKSVVAQNQRSCLVRILCVIDVGKEHGNKGSYVSFTWSYCSANLEAVAGEVWNMWEGRKRRSLPAD